MEQEILSLHNVTKRYPGVTALDKVNISFNQGEVHALVGENGAGKSTLIKIVSGAVIPDEGTITIDGETFHKLEPALSKKLGVEVIYQEFNLVDSLSVAENICLGERYGSFVDRKKMRAVAEDIFQKMGVSVPIDAPVSKLPTSHQQLVEIAKAISKKARILIMDEPTAPLSISEVENLFRVIRMLKEDGVTIIYISHRLDEIFEISDRVSVLRDGQYISTQNIVQTNRNELIKLMVGRELTESYPTQSTKVGEPVLTVSGLYGNGDSDINFTLHRGEILGVAGLVGAGRTELARMIFGADKKDAGVVYIHGKQVDINKPSDAIQHGVGLIPEDRKQQGCFLEKRIDWNVTITSLKNMSKWMIVNRKTEAESAGKFIDLLQIKTPSAKQYVRNLSGGNQQKVVIAKTIAADSDILIFDEPTRGIDVGAKQEIYQLMCDLADQGKAILMITSDMAELLGMSDRILVMSNGSISGELQLNEFSQVRVLEFASIESERKQHGKH